MRHGRTSRIACITALAVAVMGCDVPDRASCGLSESILGPDAQITTVDEVDYEPPTVSLEAVFTGIAEEVSSFAGFYVDDGELVVLVADPNDALAAVEAVRSWKNGAYIEPGHGEEGQREIRVSIVQFSWLQLTRWEQTAKVNLSGLVGTTVVGYGVDEAENVVEIGVTSSSCISAIFEVLREAGIPADAISIQREAPAGQRR